MTETALWKRNVVWFLSGQSVSLFGSMLVQYAIMWYITLDTQSGAAMTLYVVVGILPTFFMSPFGGVWADRFNRKNLINLADGGIALVTLIAAMAFFQGYKHTWLLFVCAAIRALGHGIHSPAEGAFIPQITPSEHLTRINGINSSIQSVTMIAAPVVSGALLTFMSLEMIFMIDVITAIIGITILYFRVKLPASEQATVTAPATNYFHDLKEGLKYIGKQGFILQLIVISIIYYMAVSPMAFLTPLQVTRNFGADVWRLTATEIAFSAGMMVGGLAVGFWGGFKNRIHSMALACVLMGIEGMSLGIITNFWVYIAMMFLIGLTLPFYSTPSTVVFQTQVDAAYMGRVFGVFTMVASLMMPMGMLVFGPLGDVVNIDWLLLGSGLVFCLLAIPFAVSKTLHEAGKIAPENTEKQE